MTSERDHDMRAIGGEIRGSLSLSEDELFVAAKGLQAACDTVVEVARAGKLPVTLFTARRHRDPADAAMMMQLGAEGVFVGSGIFKSGDPAQRAGDRQGDQFYDDPRAGQGVARTGRGDGRHQRRGDRGAASSGSTGLVEKSVAIEKILDLERVEVNDLPRSRLQPRLRFLKRIFGGDVAGHRWSRRSEVDRATS